jgi:DNA-binding transcriptional ArsR family regulator
MQMQAEYNSTRESGSDSSASTEADLRKSDQFADFNSELFQRRQSLQRQIAELEAEISADTPERMKALADRLRMTVLDLVLERAMTVTELAERLKRPRGTVAYHVDILVAAGLLQVVRTRRVRAVDERFYGRTARTITFHQHTPGEMAFFDDVLTEVDFARLEAKQQGAYATLRRARIPASLAEEFSARLDALSHEFIGLPRSGDLEFGLLITLYPTTRLNAP